MISSRAFYREKHGRARERFIRHHPTRCWILAFSTADVQQWFQDQGLPTIVTGFPYPGIRLPSIAVDSYAAVFHMLGGLTSRGHKRIALLTGNPNSGMPLVFLRPFMDTCKRIGADKIEPEVISVPDDAPAVVGREILRALLRKNGPYRSGDFQSAARSHGVQFSAGARSIDSS